MVKQIKKITALLFVAATMFTFASCNKDDGNNVTLQPKSLLETYLINEAVKEVK